jgi:hypothetical protein
LVLSDDGLAITDEHGHTVRLNWSEVAAVRVVHPASSSSVIGHDGSVLARIPGPLAAPRIVGGGETLLAREIAAYMQRGGRQPAKVPRFSWSLIVVAVGLIALGAVGLLLLMTR